MRRVLLLVKVQPVQGCKLLCQGLSGYGVDFLVSSVCDLDRERAPVLLAQGLPTEKEYGQPSSNTGATAVAEVRGSRMGRETEMNVREAAGMRQA